MKKHIKKIIIGVITILISSYLLYKIPPKTWDEIFKSIKNFFLKPTEIANWLIILLALFAFVVVIKFIFVFISGVYSSKEEPELENSKLDKIEEKILLYFSNYEDKDCRFPEIQEELQMSTTKLKYYLDILYNKHYIEYNRFYRFYSLDRRGRSYLINNKLINT